MRTKLITTIATGAFAVALGLGVGLAAAQPSTPGTDAPSMPSGMGAMHATMGTDQDMGAMHATMGAGHDMGAMHASGGMAMTPEQAQQCDDHHGTVHGSTTATGS
jgi:hypothetical protein